MGKSLTERAGSRGDLIPPPVSSEAGPSLPSGRPSPHLTSEVAPRGEPTSDAPWLCQFCFERTGTVYRPDGTGWLCARCASENPQICESCNVRLASITRYGYTVCARCVNEGKV